MTKFLVLSLLAVTVAVTVDAGTGSGDSDVAWQAVSRQLDAFRDTPNQYNFHKFAFAAGDASGSKYR